MITADAFVREFQRRVGLNADGKPGAQTMGKLDALLPPVQQALNLAAFFADARVEFGPFTPEQVQDVEAILKATEGWPVSWRAYALATVWHETDRTMQPIKEKGGAAYFKRMYDPQGDRPQVAARLGNTQPGDGAKFAGRGYVQLTGRTNYARYGLADRPDDAMKPDVAAHIMRDGMERGIFTGKKLGDYLPGDYVNARRIINGLDKAPEIAGYARGWEAALRAGGLA